MIIPTEPGVRLSLATGCIKNWSNIATSNMTKKFFELADKSNNTFYQRTTKHTSKLKKHANEK